MSGPELTIVVPTHARPAQLQACLEGIARLDYDHDRLEVVVVDDGGPDSLEPVVAQFRDRLDLRLLVQQRSGPGAARNLGAKVARGQFLGFIDDDCVPDPLWASALTCELRRRPDRLLGGKVVNALPNNVFSTTTQMIAEQVTAYYESGGNEPFFTTNNLGVVANRFWELEGFDTSIASFTAEDKEFCDRWRARGYEMAFVTDAVVRHSHHLTLRRFLRQHYNYGRGILALRLMKMQRGSGRLLPEPLRFYSDLVLAPLRVPSARRATVYLPLIIASQLATAAGAVRTGLTEAWKKVRPARGG